MALLWSERGDERARSSLRQALSGLRKELGESAVGALTVTDEWLALDPGIVAVEPASPGDEPSLRPAYQRPGVRRVAARRAAAP